MASDTLGCPGQGGLDLFPEWAPYSASCHSTAGQDASPLDEKICPGLWLRQKATKPFLGCLSSQEGRATGGGSNSGCSQLSSIPPEP